MTAPQGEPSGAAEEAARRYPYKAIYDYTPDWETDQRRADWVAGAEWKGAQVANLVEAVRSFLEFSTSHWADCSCYVGGLDAALRTLEGEADG